VRKFLLSPLAPGGFSSLLKINLAVCLFIFAVLQVWRPCFFLTDDNLSSGLPIFTEMGRHMKSGRTPFVTDYLFGGGYDLTRDFCFLNWHPFYLLPALLADTPARFWILDIGALGFLLLTVVGFTLLAYSLVREFNPELPVIYIVLFTASFLYSAYILNVASGWMNFLANQCALPWLALAILDRRLWWGTLVILVVSINEIFGAYAAMTLSSGLFLTVFAAGIAVFRRSFIPISSWVFGNFMTLLLCAPFLVHVLGGFVHSYRVAGMTLKASQEFGIPASIFPFSFFLGDWTGLVAKLGGEGYLQSGVFPYPSTLLACAAAWLIFPAVFSNARWRGLEILLLSLIGLLVVMVIRPMAVARVMHVLPVFKSMRWPFREGMQLLFFFHLFLLVRRPGNMRPWYPVAAILGLVLFLFPLPFFRAPTLNSLYLDREEVFSGNAARYWIKVKALLQPTDYIATVIDPALWKVANSKIPYTLLGTANFPAFYQVRCASGYSPTAPLEQLLLKTEPEYWFGAFIPKQIPQLLAERPDLKIIEVEGVDPLRISMLSNGKKIDLTPYIDK
jgi:hypothetical protein